MMEPFSKVSDRPVPLLVDNVDTDQIIPASFLKGVDRDGLAQGLFHGWRYQNDGSPDPEFVLNQAKYQGSQILMVGENFGCGSSREHAPWALKAWGFKVVLGLGFADIFMGNALRNGLLTVTLPPQRHEELLLQIKKDPEATVGIDLTAQEVTFPGGEVEGFEVNAFARHCMLNGSDPFGHLLEHLPEIEEYESRKPARVSAAQYTSESPGISGSDPVPDSEGA